MENTRPTGAESRGAISDMMLRLLVLLAVILMALAVAVVAVRGFEAATSQLSIKSGSYQAIYLVGGQVYYGKISQINGGYVKVSDAYISSGVTGTKVTVTKVSDAPTAAEDTLYVSRGEVLYWQNLQSTSPITLAINNYTGPTATPSPTPVATHIATPTPTTTPTASPVQ